MHAFSELNLNNTLLNAIEDMGFTETTPIQRAAFSVVMSGKDVVAVAQTGTGKTMAYLMPLMRMWKYGKNRIPQILIVVPTRELVIQVVEEAQALCKYNTAVILGVYGGINIKTHIEAVLGGCDVLVATPGRLKDLAMQGALKLKGIKKLVIDEVDEMLNLGFRHQLEVIFDLLPERRQNLMFSATLSEEVREIIENFFYMPEKIAVTSMQIPTDNIRMLGYPVPNFHSKLKLVRHLLQTDDSMQKVLLFVDTKKWADQICEGLYEDLGETVGVIHSNKTQNNRFATIEKFADGHLRVLVATDLVARGIDIAEVSHVINFDIPEIPENYVHRIGRTGRVQHKGVAISLVSEAEIPLMEAIETQLNLDIPVADWPEAIEVSTELLPEEQPKTKMKNIFVKGINLEESEGNIHEKLPKNSKVTKKIRHVELMKMKYKRPISRGSKSKYKGKK